MNWDALFLPLDCIFFPFQLMCSTHTTLMPWFRTSYTLFNTGVKFYLSIESILQCTFLHEASMNNEKDEERRRKEKEGRRRIPIGPFLSNNAAFRISKFILILCANDLLNLIYLLFKCSLFHYFWLHLIGSSNRVGYSIVWGQFPLTINKFSRRWVQHSFIYWGLTMCRLLFPGLESIMKKTKFLYSELYILG